MPLAKPGDTLHDNNGNSFVIKKFLGEGVTAEVFKATQQDGTLAALKILRPDLPPEIIQSFRDEAIILGELVLNSKERYPDAPLHTPEVLGQGGGNNSKEFLAMEFIVGQPLDELIVATRGLVTLEREVEALSIAKQVLQVLVVLHVDIRRSYIDFQLKNIWWQQDIALAKVMDWNHVSTRVAKDTRPPGAVDDLVRFGAYLYQLLTGKGAFQTGETEAELAKRADANWEKVSLGTRFILLKALHPNPQNRYQSAQDFLDDIEIMLSLWQQDEDDLYDEANIALRQAKNRDPQSGIETTTAEEYIKAVVTATRAIDLYIRRGGQGRIVDRMRGELKEITDDISPIWGTGRNFYQMGVYSEALKRWELEAESLERLDLWRWVVLAKLGQEMGDAFAPLKTLLEDAVAQMDREEWAIAETTLKQVHAEGTSSPLLCSLTYEAEAQSWMKQALFAEKVKEWRKASQAYEEAAKSLQQIQDETYLRLMRESLSTPDQLQERAKACRQQDKGFEQESDAVNELRLRIAQKQNPAGYLIEQLLENPGQLRLLDVTVEEAEKMSRADAVQLLSAAAFFGHANPSIYDRLAQKWNEQHEIEMQQSIVNYETLLQEEDSAKAAVRTKQHKAWIQEQANNLNQALQAFKWKEAYSIAADMGGDVPLETKQTIQTQFEQAIGRKDWIMVFALGNALSAIGDDAERIVIKQHVDDALLSQDLDLKRTRFDKYLLAKQFDKANVLLTDMVEKVDIFHDDDTQVAWKRKLELNREDLVEREKTFVAEASIEQVITQLNQQGLQELGMKIEKNLQSLTEEVDEVKKENSALKKQNEQLLKKDRLSSKKGWSGGRVLAIVAFILFLFLMGLGGYGFIKTQQIYPLATQLGGGPPEPENNIESPTAISSGSEIAGALPTETPTSTPTLTPQPTATDTLTPTNTPTPTPIPAPTIGDSLQINSIPASPVEFMVPEDATNLENLVSYIPEEIDQITYYDLDNVFDWPEFELMLNNGWLFDLSGETVMLKHQGQSDALPLRVQVNGENGEPVSEIVPVLVSWLVNMNESVDSSTISIDGNKVRDPLLQSGMYRIAWLTDGEDPLEMSTPITYTKPITTTLNEGTDVLRLRPVWDPKFDKSLGDLEINTDDNIFNVIGYVCNKYNDASFMFFAVVVSEKNNGIYWLANSKTQEFQNKDATSFQPLIEAFDNIDVCLAE